MDADPEWANANSSEALEKLKQARQNIDYHMGTCVPESMASNISALMNNAAGTQNRNIH